MEKTENLLDCLPQMSDLPQMEDLQDSIFGKQQGSEDSYEEVNEGVDEGVDEGEN